MSSYFFCYSLQIHKFIIWYIHNVGNSFLISMCLNYVFVLFICLGSQPRWGHERRRLSKWRLYRGRSKRSTNNVFFQVNVCFWSCTSAAFPLSVCLMRLSLTGNCCRSWFVKKIGHFQFCCHSLIKM
mgnify:CR=1 FL=1